jgi:hypothetical protein
MEIDLANLPDDAGALKALVQQLLGTVKTQGLKIAQLEARLLWARLTGRCPSCRHLSPWARWSTFAPPSGLILLRR